MILLHRILHRLPAIRDRLKVARTPKRRGIVQAHDLGAGDPVRDHVGHGGAHDARAGILVGAAGDNHVQAVGARDVAIVLGGGGGGQEEEGEGRGAHCREGN